MPFPTAPVVPRTTNETNVVFDVLKETSAPTVQHLPKEKENCLFSPTRRGALPAAGNHAPTVVARPSSCWPVPTTAANTGKGFPVGDVVPQNGVLPPDFFYPSSQEEVGPIFSATTRPPKKCRKERESEQEVGRHTQPGRGCGGNKNHGRKSARKSGGGIGTVKQRGGGLCVHNLLVGLLLMVVCGLVEVEGYAKLPNGDGSNSATGNAGTLRRAVSDWIAGGASKSTVVATYGSIEDWDVSEVTNMKYVFYNFRNFNADLSKWNTGAVTRMDYSKCTLSLPLSVAVPFPLLSILNIRQFEFHRITILTRFVLFAFVF